ncbi:MAG: DNA-directed RNA polymerase subunit B'', partial [Nanoarchaeota archaeon]
MEKNSHIIVKKYLQEHSLVESNIISFNNFLDKRMQEIVDEISNGIESEEFEIKLGKITIGKPTVIEADGSSSFVTPAEARIRNLTYSAPIHLEITIKQDNQTDSQNVEIGKIPIMVKSKACNTYGMSKEELIANYNDPLDPGGYFIINGNERVMVMTEDLAENQPFIEKKKEGEETLLRLFSLRGAYRIPISISESKEGVLEASFSRFRNLPAIILLKSLGMTSEQEISKTIGKETDSLIVNLYEYASISNPEDAMMQIAEKTSLQGTKKEVLDRIKQRIDSYFLPHIGQKKEDRIKKAKTFCKLIKQFLIAKEDKAVKTDKDHYANKRVRLSGDLLSSLFRVNLSILVRDIQYSLQKISKRRKFYSIKTIAKSTLFSHRVESAIATGSWIGERTGVTQNMDKTNYLASISQLQRVASMLPGEQENFLARTLHPTHYGRFCPIETPEGTEIGLRKNLAILSRISTFILLSTEDFIKEAEKIGLSKQESSYDLFFNGIYVGGVENAKDFVKMIREKRRISEFSMEMGVRLDNNLKVIYVSTEVGRVLRPLIIAERGVSRLKNEHLIGLEQGTVKWDDLIKEGVIEYLDAAEEENALVALYPEDLTEEHTHLEIDPMDLLGVVTSLVPYGNHDQSSRLNRGSKTQKQALGLYAANYHCRLDTDVSILEYPQKPIVRSFVYDTLNIYPAGQNVVVAIMTYEGYNMDDSIVLNKGSIDRGMGRSFFFRPYSAVELNYAGGLKDEIETPQKDVSGYRTESTYRLLEADGIIYPEAEVKEGDVLIGKTSPPKFLSEARELSIKTRKESSTVVRQEEKGVVDSVFFTEDGEGNFISQIRVRDQRIPELGDKFATSHGQKGVVGAIVPEEDIPFTSRGIRPDIIFNPHGIPGRMTVG